MSGVRRYTIDRPPEKLEALVRMPLRFKAIQCILIAEAFQQIKHEVRIKYPMMWFARRVNRFAFVPLIGFVQCLLCLSGTRNFN